MIKCTYEGGNVVSLRHVTTGAIIVRDGKILLEKRGSYKNKKWIMLESGKWALIGGFLDRDETIDEGLRREILEEVGFEVGKLTLFRINHNPNRPHEDRQNVDFIYIADEILKEGSPDGVEVSELKWFDLNNLPPQEEMAFDHLESIELYKKFLKEKFPIPIY